ncbi:MAG: hypothetical protein AB7K36_28555 [Chloroflexota bacterium]
MEQLAEIGPRVVLPGEPPALPSGAVPPARHERQPLPPEQRSDAYDFLPLDADAEGWRRFQVRIQSGGSPSLVAMEKLTPLFNVDGKGPVQYVTDAFFEANPQRTPRSIQPGDEFILRVPPDTFVVRWQEEREDPETGGTHLREYVSDRGDRLLLYLSDRFPILYELDKVDLDGQARLRFHPDLAFMLGSGQIDPLGLARVIYRVQDPDLVQVQTTRRLAAGVKPGEAAELTVDRTRTFLDPVREAMRKATIVEHVPNIGRHHLTRAVFVREDVAPFLAVEDALGTQPDISGLPLGQVFRIEYGRDGVVQVSYLTGDDDERGKRDPYELRENERWAEIYGTYLDTDASPVAWGPGEPSDIAPFPTARDPNRRVQEGERSYDYLRAGRAIRYTFRPTRTRADLRTDAELANIFHELGKQYKGVMSEAQEIIPELRR